MSDIERRRADDARLDRIEADMGRLARGMAIVHKEQRAFHEAAARRSESVPPWISRRLNLRDAVWAIAVLAALWRGDTAAFLGFLTGRATAPAVVSQPVATPEPAP